MRLLCMQAAAILWVVFAGVAFPALPAAQQSRKSLKTAKPRAELSEAYAKAAVAALTAIRTDETVPHIDDGNPVGDKDTNRLIEAAGALGQSPAEASTTAALNAIYRDRLLDNDRRNTKKMAYESDSGLEDEGTREMTAQQEMLSDAELQQMDRKEKACFDAMDAALQSRSSAAPSACVSWSPALKALQKTE